MNEWTKSPLSELIVLHDSKRIPLSSLERQKKQGIFPYYGAASIMDYVDEYIFDGDYILLGEDGTVITDKGKPVLQMAHGKFWVNNHAHVITATELCDFRFLYYALMNSNVQSIVTGAVQPKISQGNLKSLQLPLPPLPIQRKIAAVLGSIDDKIENNRKICANLEAQAQALFKSWFVDFEPFGGKMPKGWKIGKLGDVAEITMGQSPDGSSLNEKNDGITFFQGRAEFGSRFPTKRLSTTKPKRMAKKGDVLLSVRAPVGDLNVALDDCCIGRGLAAVQSKDEAQSFLYYLLQSKKPEFDLYEGSGTIFGSINKDSLHGLSVILPETSILKKFEEVVSSIDRMYHEQELESRTLASLRDALLPKLMSGEIDVDKVAV